MWPKNGRPGFSGVRLHIHIDTIGRSSCKILFESSTQVYILSFQNALYYCIHSNRLSGCFPVPVHIHSFYFIAKKYPLCEYILGVHNCLGPTLHWGGNGVSFDVRSLALPRLIMQCTLLSFSLPHRPCKSGVYPDCKFFTLNTYQPISISSIL